MQIEAIVQKALLASAQLAALVPPARIRADGDNVQLAAPYIIHGALRDQAVRTHDGLHTLRLGDYQVSCYAQDLSVAYQIADAVAAALDAAPLETRLIMQLAGRQRSYDADARLWVVDLDFRSAYWRA